MLLDRRCAVGLWRRGTTAPKPNARILLADQFSYNRHMANADIVSIGLDEVDLLTDLYNNIFIPAKNADFFSRRFKGRVGMAILVAHLDKQPVGFATGFELKPSTYFYWLCGVVPDARRSGIGSQLFEAMCSWARDEGYHSIRFECYSKHRPMLHLAINCGFDIVGLRWDNDGHDNLIIFEMNLEEKQYEEG